MRKALGTYMVSCGSGAAHVPQLTLSASSQIAKYEADLNLTKRKGLPWFILRPSTLLDDAGAGRVSLAARVPIPLATARGRHADPAVLLRDAFALTIADMEEGLVLKAAEARYGERRLPWVKVCPSPRCFGGRGSCVCDS